MSTLQRENTGVLVLGATGLLGKQLVLRSPRAGSSAALAVRGLSSKDLDVRDRRSVAAMLGALRPRWVINAAAYTDVDGCESDPARAFAVNAEGVRNVADACCECGAFLVHYSTDFVFDGNATRPYQTTDVPAPISVYGQSKLAGEVAVQESGCDHLIIRTSWLFGPGGKNFVDTICSRAASGGELRVVTDQMGRPTFNVDLADATWRLLGTAAHGVIHFCNSGACSWYTLASEALQRAGLHCKLEPITSEALGRPAQRPQYSVLDTGEYERWTGLTPRHWTAALGEYLSERRFRAKESFSPMEAHRVT